jgi:Fungal Zn(2)-Cys(6) binuclear cluster domain
MPRPKVRPEDRQRSSKACLPCQASKIRCDSLKPCTSCVRRDKAASCAYNESHRRRLSRVNRNRELRFAPYTGPSTEAPSSTPSRPVREPRTYPPEEGHDDEENEENLPLEAASTIAPPVHSPECTESRLLLSSKGEKGNTFVPRNIYNELIG